MNETQLVLALLPPLATLATVIVGFLYSNSRISDLRTDMVGRLGDMNGRMGDMGARIGDVNKRIDDLRTEVKDLVRAQSAAHTSDLRRVEEMMLGKFAELGNRLSRIETHLHLH